jgi:hypothetical protein
MPDPFPQQTNGSLGASESLTDLSGRVALQAQFQDGAFFLVQSGKKLLDRFAQHGCFKRCRLAA